MIPNFFEEADGFPESHAVQSIKEGDEEKPDAFHNSLGYSTPS
jgi:hypothetical protein